ncbi:MAG: transcription termination factor NusA [Oscillospiraceae bacterium]|jgi:N utilization substance protein A|nr:transcription termination factor NusA [Oscillospiraceae bacterium]
MVNKPFFEALRELAKDKGVQLEALYDGISRAIVTAVRSDYHNKDVVFCEILPETDEMKVFIRKTVVNKILRKTVVEEVEDPTTQILPEEAERYVDDPQIGDELEIEMEVDPDLYFLPDQAEKYKPGARPGDIIEIELDTREMSRIQAQKGKHVLRQGIREAEQGRLREEFQSREDEIVTVKVQRVEPNGDCVVEIGRVEEILPADKLVPGEIVEAGDLIKVYVESIHGLDAGDPHATLSRIHPGIVKRLLEIEVPEIKEGYVEIVAVAREAGSRSKVAVRALDEDIDPVGACIGPRGSRVARVIDLLGGEKIDIVEWSEDVAEFVANALSPAEVLSVKVIDTDDHVCHIVVPDDKFSLAIGVKGQNARLAAKLTTWKIDIRSDKQVTAAGSLV